MTDHKQGRCSMRAGAARVDITPEPGTQLAGLVGRHRPAQLVADPLYAKSLVLESDGRKLCFVALDLTIPTETYSSRIRRAASEELGIEYEAVMLHATQTHSAPALGHFLLDRDFEGIPPGYEWIRGGDDRYSAFAVERAIEAIRLADGNLQPVRVAVGSGIEGRPAFNRRAVMRNGMVQMLSDCWRDPLGPTGIRYIEGPIDPELGVMCFRADSLRMVAMLVNYTCHPVHVYGQSRAAVSADWPGALANSLQEGYGKGCVPMVLNGACGNINVHSQYDPDHVPDYRRAGKLLASTSNKIIETLSFKEESVLGWKSQRLRIPLREVEAEELKEAEKILADHPEPLWADEKRARVSGEWMRAAGVYSVHLASRRDKKLDYEIQVFRVGNTAFVALPGEPFVEGGLRIKLASPAYPTYIVHNTSQYVGYIPTREAFRRGGHEVRTSYWAKLVPEALDMIVDKATDLLAELFGKGVSNV